MTTVTVQRRIGKTGRPLGLLDVLSKIAETAAAGLTAWWSARASRESADAVQQRDLAKDAAQARRLADRYRNSAPGFASDLYAAADQHELMSPR